MVYNHPFLIMIIVCSLSDLVDVCESVKPKYLISVIDPGYEPETPTEKEFNFRWHKKI